MSQMHFDGPVEVDPKLAMAMWEAMTDVGKQGVAQLFFNRFITAPVSEAALTAGARVFFEKNKIPSAAATALKEAVGKRCVELAEKLADTKSVRDIVEDESRKAAAEYAKTHIDMVLSAVPMDALIAAATPVVLEVIRSCAHHYFTRSQPGQDWLLALVHRVCDNEGEVKSAVLAKIGEAARPLVNDVA